MSDQIISSKTCNKCGVEKSVTEFHVNNKKQSGPSRWKASCRICLNKIQLGQAIPTLFHCGNCKNIKPKTDFFRAVRNNPISQNNLCTHCHLMETDKSYKCKQRFAAYYAKNPEKKIRKGRNRNLESAAKSREKYEQKMADDPLFKIKYNLRRRIQKAVKGQGYSKCATTSSVLGADYDTVKAHFELFFNDGMGWDNMGEWHIDHIIPLAAAKDEKTLIALNHYKNLRPLWGHENLAKNDNMPSNDEISSYGLEDLYKLVA